MTKLDCNVVNCAFNKDNCCRRSEIDVQGSDAKMASETSCGSFSAKGCGCTANYDGCTCKETEVKCEAVECKFNKSHKCSAKHIGISGGHADSVRETECASFVC